MIKQQLVLYMSSGSNLNDFHATDNRSRDTNCGLVRSYMKRLDLRVSLVSDCQCKKI